MNVLDTVIEGNIGAGKTTAIGALCAGGAASLWVTVPELFPTALLRPMYEGRAGASLAFQCWMTAHRVSAALPHGHSAGARQWRLRDRGLFGDTVFAVAQRAMGHMTLDELALVAELRDAHAPSAVEHCVILYAPPEVALERVRARGRPAEVDLIDYAYLEMLDALHLELLLRTLAAATRAGTRTGHCVVDWTQPGDTEHLRLRLAMQPAHITVTVHAVLSGAPSPVYADADGRRCVVIPWTDTETAYDVPCMFHQRPATRTRVWRELAFAGASGQPLRIMLESPRLAPVVDEGGWTPAEFARATILS